MEPPTVSHPVTPYLLVEGALQVIEFCQRVFGATLLGALTRPDGSLMHAELDVAGGRVMLGEPMGEFDAMPGAVFVRVDDCDATYAAGLEAGGVSLMEVSTMEHAGERYGGVKDPAGNVWWIATGLEAVSWAESQRRIDALVEQDLGR